MEHPFTYYLYSIGFPIIGLIIAIVAGYKGYEIFRRATYEHRADEGPTRDQRKAASDKKKSVQLIELYAQLFVEMARAEGGVFTPAKQEMIMDFARNRLRYDKARLEHFTKYMQKSLETPEELDFLLSRMAKSFPYMASLLVMELMIKFLHIQEPPSPGSQRLANTIIEALSINTDDLTILNKKFQYQREHPGVDWKEQQDASFENAEDEDMVSEDQHYQALGLPVGSDFAAIKRAYRVLAMQYHPDHVEHLGDEFKTLADEKMRAINSAYTHFEKKFRLLQR